MYVTHPKYLLCFSLIGVHGKRDTDIQKGIKARTCFPWSTTCELLCGCARADWTISVLMVSCSLLFSDTVVEREESWWSWMWQVEQLQYIFLLLSCFCLYKNVGYLNISFWRKALNNYRGNHRVLCHLPKHAAGQRSVHWWSSGCATLTFTWRAGIHHAEMTCSVYQAQIV